MQAVDTGLMDYFFKSDTGQQLAKQRQEELMDKRKESVTAIEKIKGEQEKNILKLNSGVDEARKKVERARKSLEKTEKEFHEAQRVKRSKANQYDLQIGNHERYLKDTSDPMIAAFILELRDKADVLMGKEIDVIKRQGKRNPFTMKRENEDYSNIEEVKETLFKIREAIHQAETLKLIAVDNAAEQLEEIRQNIPGIKVMASSVWHKLLIYKQGEGGVNTYSFFFSGPRWLSTFYAVKMKVIGVSS